MRTTAATTSPRRVAMASLIGTTIEWYDYFIYGLAAAMVFGPLFFPEFSSVAGTLAAFATFSVGFLSRPLGGIVMGHFGDKVGRKSMLVISLMMMGIATVGIGLLPTYSAIGVWAPILLVTFRLIQGVGVGGEWGGAVLMAVEHAPARKRSFYGSFPQMGVPAGLILANLAFLGITAAVSEEAFLAWGWRIPFLLSAALVVVGIVIRFSITESPDFEKMKRDKTEEKMPVVTVLRRNPKEVALAAGTLIGINAVSYIFMTYLLSYSTSVLDLPRTQILIFVLVASVAWLVVIPTASVVADRRGNRTVMLVGSVGMVIASLALFPLVDTAIPALILVALFCVAVVKGMVHGPLAALYADLFPAEIRYSGVSLAYQIGAILGGGFAPTIATGLYASFGSSVPITMYLGLTTIVGLTCVYLIGRRRTPGAAPAKPEPATSRA
ncbi:MFS transporter [Saccharomonospora sp. NPDC006951]